MTELRVFLVRHGLRQQDLADGVGLSRVAISLVINGKSAPRPATAEAIVNFCRRLDPEMTHARLFGFAASEAAPEKGRVSA